MKPFYIVDGSSLERKMLMGLSIFLLIFYSNHWEVVNETIFCYSKFNKQVFLSKNLLKSFQCQCYFKLLSCIKQTPTTKLFPSKCNLSSLQSTNMTNFNLTVFINVLG